MPATAIHQTSSKHMDILSRLLLSPLDIDAVPEFEALKSIKKEEFDEFVALAHSNHVIVRGLEIFQKIMVNAQDSVRAEWAAIETTAECARIDKAVGSLRLITNAFDQEGFDLTVMKSLDHWPDLGSDLDLYTNAPAQAVCEVMQRRFGATIDVRSWGDRLAGKWNFLIPGLAESVEVHTGRLGQTGEQLALASWIPERSRLIEVGPQSFRVPSASDRLMISTLQRMYRHFYFRLCDIVDSATLVNSGAVDFADLQASAQTAGIWEGVATYMVIVSDYVKRYSGKGLALPKAVTDAARFGGDLVYFGKKFLRVPIMPQSASLYRSQFAGLLRRRELQSSARLGLLPWLATAAAVSHKITGSDKGIW